MEDFLIKFLFLIISFFIGSFSWFLNELYKKINSNFIDIQEVKSNYLDRFDNINSKLEDIHIDIALIKNKINSNSNEIKR